MRKLKIVFENVLLLENTDFKQTDSHDDIESNDFNSLINKIDDLEEKLKVAQDEKGIYIQKIYDLQMEQEITKINMNDLHKKLDFLSENIRASEGKNNHISSVSITF